LLDIIPSAQSLQATFFASVGLLAAATERTIAKKRALVRSMRLHHSQ
jgi:hypothetical protein